MYQLSATSPGDPNVPNEDWHMVTPDLVVVCDGATVRTETGCRHGAAWYASRLGMLVAEWIALNPDMSLRLALRAAISDVCGRHGYTCNLDHPGTPSAGIAVVHRHQEMLRYLVLGDVSIVIDTTSGPMVISDQRVSATASAERAEADVWPIGTDQKAAALLKMKPAELAARNVEGGYWIAAADPSAAEHAITGEIPFAEARRFAVLTDGAMRYSDLFNMGDLSSVLDVAPDRLIRLVRNAEDHDPLGIRYPRNKRHDDATAVLAQPLRASGQREELSDEERAFAAEQFLARINHPSVMGDGMSLRSV